MHQHEKHPPAPDAPPADVPPARGSLGASLAVAAGLLGFVLFFLPWHHVLGAPAGAEPRWLTDVRGLDRATGVDLAARVAGTPVGYRQLGDGRREPISAAALGRPDIQTAAGQRRAVLWLVPVLAAGIFAVSLFEALTRSRVLLSAAATVAALAETGLLAWEAGYMGGSLSGPFAGEGFVVVSAPALPLHLAVGAAVFAALAAGIGLAHGLLAPPVLRRAQAVGSEAQAPRDGE